MIAKAIRSRLPGLDAASRRARRRRHRGLAILLTIAVLAPVKIWVWGNLFGQTVGRAPRIFRTTTASAQTAPDKKGKKDKKAKPASKAAEKKKGAAEGGSETAKGAKGGKDGGKDPAEKATSKESSETDVALIRALREKEATLKRREVRLQQQEARLERLRRDIERKVAELRAIQAKIESYVVRGKKLSEERLKRLAKVYESAPPEKAGLLISELDPSLAAVILMRMDGRKAGRIWGFVEQGKAVRISREMTKLR
ncbi:MAG: MotE family protein [Nitrospinota bacterium]